MKRGLLVFSLVALAACPASTSSPPDTTQGAHDPGPSDEPGPGVTIAEPSEDGSIPGPTLPAGQPCNDDSECDAEEVCEGPGCEAGQGRCTPRDRMCTRDLQTYCGCEGKDFQSSGSCPGARFAFRGSCAGGLGLGESCTHGSQCSSGLCTGEGLEGCHAGARGICSEAACTKDLATYCSCNGFELRGSGTCPNQQFAHRGPCEG